MYSAIKDQLQGELEDIRSAGLFKTERHIDSPQAGRIQAGQLGEASASVLNFCANNYLGLADHPDIIAAAKAAMDQRGFGMASVRFICAPRTSTWSWKRGSPGSSARRTPSCSPAAS